MQKVAFIDTPDIRKALDQAGILYRESGDHVYMTCFFCNKDWKLYFNYKKNIGDCKRCGKIINLNEFCTAAGIDIEVKTPTVKDLVTLMKKQVVKDNPVDDEEEKTVVSIPLSISALNNKKAYNYLTQRGLDDETIEKHDLRYCNKGRFKNRIIIPIVDSDNKLTGYQGRLVTFEEDLSVPKYLFSSGFRKTKNLFGLNNIATHKKVINKLVNISVQYKSFVILTEGVFTAMLLGGVATFGKSFSKGQLDLLLTKLDNISRLILLWDSDSWNKIGKQIAPVEKAYNLLKDYFEVRVIKLPENDDGTSGQPDDHNIEYLKREISKSWKQANWWYEPEL